MLLGLFRYFRDIIRGLKNWDFLIFLVKGGVSMRYLRLLCQGLVASSFLIQYCQEAVGRFRREFLVF